MALLTTEQDPFRDFTSDELARVEALAETRSYEPGDFIVKQREEVGAMYVIIDGQVRVTAVMGAGSEGADEEILVQLKPNEVFGELSFVTGEAPNLSVIADAATRVAVIPHASLHELIGDDASICRKLLFAITRTLVARLRDTGRELVLSRYFIRGS